MNLDILDRATNLLDDKVELSRKRSLQHDLAQRRIGCQRLGRQEDLIHSGGRGMGGRLGSHQNITMRVTGMGDR